MLVIHLVQRACNAASVENMTAAPKLDIDIRSNKQLLILMYATDISIHIFSTLSALLPAVAAAAVLLFILLGITGCDSLSTNNSIVHT